MKAGSTAIQAAAQCDHGAEYCERQHGDDRRRVP